MVAVGILSLGQSMPWMGLWGSWGNWLASGIFWLSAAGESPAFCGPCSLLSHLALCPFSLSTSTYSSSGRGAQGMSAPG
jgi:hypothetical protein